MLGTFYFKLYIYIKSDILLFERNSEHRFLRTEAKWEGCLWDKGPGFTIGSLARLALKITC